MDEWLWSNGGMILTGENWSTGRKTSPSATLSTTHLKWTDLVSNPRLCAHTNFVCNGTIVSLSYINWRFLNDVLCVDPAARTECLILFSLNLTNFSSVTIIPPVPHLS